MSIIRRMRPHEQTISVGGIDVHTWVGGRRPPAAGAPRRRRQSWLAPLDGPGGGALHGLGADPSRLRRLRRRGVDGRRRRPRPLLSVVHRRGEARPAPPARPVARRLDGGGDGDDEPGRRSIGWCWPRRPGSSRRRGEILDVFYHSPQQLRDHTVHDPKTQSRVGGAATAGRPRRPSWRSPTRNREMSARLTWKPYMHNPRLRALPAARDEPDADRVGTRGPDRAGRCAASSTAGCCPTPRSRARAVRPPAAHRAAGRLRARSCSTSSEERPGDEALLLQRDAASRVSRRGGRQVPLAAPRLPEPLLRPRDRRRRTTSAISTSTSSPTRSASTGS